MRFGTVLSAALVGLLVAGCSSGADAGPRSLPTLTPAPTPSSLAPSIPPQATGNTSQALDAFVRFYFQQLNVAFSTADPAIIRGLSDPHCVTCENYAKSLKDKDFLIKGESFSRVEVAVPPINATGTIVEAFGVVPPREVVDRSGKVKRRLASDGRFHFQLNVVRKGPAWIVRGIRLADS